MPGARLRSFPNVRPFGRIVRCSTSFGVAAAASAMPPVKRARPPMDSRSSCKSRAQLTGWRYSLRGALVFISLVAVSLAICRLVHPVWVILFFVYALLTYCFSRPTILRRVWLPLVFAALHTTLITIASIIEYASAWDDMNPTFLVAMVTYIFDYPIHSAYRHLGLFPGQFGLWYLAQLIVTGGLLWFGVGLLLKMILSLLMKLLPNRK